MYERINNLCKEKGITVSQMCRELSITRSCLSELSKGRTESLSATNTGKIAKYFGVSVGYITDGETDTRDEDLKFALFNGAEGITDEMFEEVKQFAEMVKLREQAKKSKESR
jgi:transcriptional regulator with XRE-family HTH domain